MLVERLPRVVESIEAGEKLSDADRQALVKLGGGRDRMQTAESIRRTIASTEELQSVVKTMKALAGVNIRQYERAAHAVAEYNRTVEMGLQIALQRVAHALVCTAGPALGQARRGRVRVGPGHVRAAERSGGFARDACARKACWSVIEADDRGGGGCGRRRKSRGSGGRCRARCRCPVQLPESRPRSRRCCE